MGKVDIPGLHSVKRTLADGTSRTYHYAWRGGPRLTGEPGSPEFLSALERAKRDAKQPDRNTMHALVAAYRTTTEYTGRSASSKRAYAAYLAMIEEKFGDMTLNALQDRRARGVFKAWRDSMSETPRKADYAWTVLARVLSVAKDRGTISDNRCERGGRLYRTTRRDLIWTEDHVARFVAVASPQLRRALVLALWTGQRQGDLLRVKWTAYAAGAIRFQQSKTDARVVVPVAEVLRQELAQIGRKDDTILTNQAGQPWTSDGFRASWRKACGLAGIRDVTFHDLRGTAVVCLALAGCETPEIAAITGHSLKDASDILDKHYLGKDVRLAEAAMRKREAFEAKERGEPRPEPL